MKRFLSLINLKGDDQYHRQIDKIAGFRSPSDPDFPWDQLRIYTDAVIRKQKGISIPEGLDQFLSDFIRHHARKDIAVAACVHSLSRDCTLRLLTGHLKAEVENYHSLPTYLQCIVAVNHMNPVAVGSDEAERARELIRLLRKTSENHILLLQPMIKKFINGIPSSSLLAPHYSYLLILGAKAQNTVLDTLRNSGQWAQAYAAASWLSRLPYVLPHAGPGYGYLDGEKVLDTTMPSWRSWASWKPHEKTLALMADKLNSTDRMDLKDILALEGPCFDYSNCSTLREGLAATATSTDFNQGSALFAFEKCVPQYIAKQLRNVMFQLFRALLGDYDLDNTRTKLFKRVCLGRTITEASLGILDMAFSNGDSSVIEGIQELLQAFDEDRMPGYSHLVDLLEHSSREGGAGIEKLFGEKIRKSLYDAFKHEQMRLKKVVLANRPWISEDCKILTNLYRMGKRLVDVPGMLEAMDDVRTLLEQWPDLQQITSCFSIIIAAQTQSNGAVNHLSKKVARYMVERMVDANSLDTNSLRLVESLMGLWNAKPDIHCRTVAILISRSWSDVDSFFQCRCVESLIRMQGEDVKTIRTILENTENPGDVCTAFARYLVDTLHLQGNSFEYIESWREVLLRLIEAEGDALLDWALQNLASQAWLLFLDDLATIFAHKIPWDQSVKSFFLKPALHQWIQQVSQHAGVLKRLEQEDSMRFGPAIQCLLRGGTLDIEEELHRILQLLDTNSSDTKWKILQKVTARLKIDGKNAEDIRKAMVLVRGATPDGDEALQHALEIYEEVSPEVAEIMLLSWHGELDLMPMDKIALEALATVLGLEINEDVPMDSLRTTENWIQERYKELLAEAHRLESLRIAFKNLEDAEISELLDELGIEDTSPVDDLLQHLPPDLINVVDKVAENEVEMSIPLSDLTALQRKAMGAGTAQNLLVRFTPGYSGMTPGFCLHFDTEEKSVYDISEHEPCLVLGHEPEEHRCFGRKTPAIYQMSRILSEEIRRNGFTSLSVLYNFLIDEIKTLSSKCIVCGALHGYRLRRATVCGNSKCEMIYEKTDIEVRLGDIRIDSAVVDLLLTAIYASARQNNQSLSLLTGCPITEPQRIKYIIDNLPAIASLQSGDLAKSLADLDIFQTISEDAISLLSWACNSYKGFLSSVTPNLKIPSFPGTHQFILANASPSQEIAFASKIVRGTTQVMFHGTTMERLNAILREGLKDLSGSSLQRHGQSYGRGVYVSSEPSTAWGYTYASSSWKGSTFSNYRVLLGVELAGDWPAKSSNIHVISDPQCLMVRYVILCPNNLAIPIAGHVVPAMQSAFNSLRSGAI